MIPLVRAVVGCAALSVAIGPSVRVLHSQGIRLRGVTTTRMLELQRFEDDSVAGATTLPYAGAYRQTANGLVVRCDESEAWCHYKRSGETASAIPIWQDLQATAWGLGEGISVHADMRFRGAAGSLPALWPRSQDRFDLLSGYVELDRTRFTVRAGRQFITNGLGVYNFDGGVLNLRPSRVVSAELWGGRSLLRGINEGYTSSEIASVEELPPDREAAILGASMRWRPARGSALRVMYQREARWNGGWRSSGLYSDRIAADGTTRLLGGALDGSYEFDLAAKQTNEARLRWRGVLPRGFEAAIEGRRFRPFFELWTIWGAFAPVGFDELRLDGGWATHDHTISLDLFGGWRKWQDANVGLAYAPLRQTGWRAGGDLTARPLARWVASAHYDADVGAGASREEVDLGLRYEASDAAYIGIAATQLESLYEFRIGTGRMLGGGLDAGVRLTPAIRLMADAMLYRHTQGSGSPYSNWNQRRASVRLEWTVGGDPGLRTGVRGAP
jgi:hypothetical protein